MIGCHRPRNSAKLRKFLWNSILLDWTKNLKKKSRFSIPQQIPVAEVHKTKWIAISNDFSRKKNGLIIIPSSEKIHRKRNGRNPWLTYYVASTWNLPTSKNLSPCSQKNPATVCWRRQRVAIVLVEHSSDALNADMSSRTLLNYCTYKTRVASSWMCQNGFWARVLWWGRVLLQQHGM